MPAKHDVAVLVGSLRANSYSARLAEALIAVAPDTLNFHRIGIANLPLYNQDLDDNPPAPYTDFRHAIASSGAVLFVSPEYNRSIPGGLKNAIDVGSRPAGKNVFNGKPAAVVTQTPGAIGGFGANHALRQALVFLNMPTLQQPEAYIGHSDKIFAEDGSITDEGTKVFLAKIMHAFSDWIAVQS
jgi:chromate reductase